MIDRIVGLQSMVFGKECIIDDITGVLDDVATAGYQGMETGNLGETISGKVFRAMLHDRG